VLLPGILFVIRGLSLSKMEYACLQTFLPAD
jgi:hypothetical protein